MRIGIRSRFVLFTLSLLLVSALVFDGYMVSALGSRLAEQAASDLKVRGALVAARVMTSGDLDKDAPRLATELAAAAEARVTIINPNGVVRGDSSVSGSGIAVLESHATRPEVIEALEQGVGVSERFSSTLYGRMLYVAHRLDRSDGRWIVRLAHEPLAIEAMIAEMRTRLLYGTLLALGVAGVLALVSARVFTRSIQHLTETARTMRRDLSKRTHLRGGDDIARLGEELDALAAELERSIGDLSHQRERLEAMLEAMQEGVMVLGENGAITVANRALRRMLLAGDVIGKQPIEVVRNAELHEILRESARTRRPVTRELSFGSIRRRRVRVQVSPLAGPEGRGGLVAVFSDVTELRRLETLRRDFVANVSHELRTPIASIRATSETLRGGALDDPEMAKEFVEIIDRNAQRLHRLVEDLLDLSKIEAKELDLKIQPLDAREEAQAVVDLLRHSAEQRTSHVVVEAPEGLKVQADPRALEQILTNLVDNAIKYGPPGTRVALRARRSLDRPGRVTFEIADDGPGIDAAHLPRLFERFYRVDTGRSRALGGTGLGLAIVKHLAEALGGEVSVESALGRGSSFRVDLPASTGDGASARESATDQRQG
jgi:two-component system phosphate regulon sensor histidine kinase PhoR